MALLYGYSIWHNQSILLADGRRAFWLHDDMMISMRYARNLADGQGLVWNPGLPPVQGYSNFGWVLVLAAVHFLPLADIHTSLFVLLLNMALSALVLVQTTRLARRLFPAPKTWLFPALLGLIILVDLARWATIGLEVPLLTAVFLWLLIRVLDEAAENSPRPTTFFLAGILGLIRVDGPLLALILCLVAFGLQTNRKRVLAYAPLILILPLALTLFQLVYYGQPLPNTYYLKLTAWNTRIQPGLGYLLRVLKLYWPLLLAALLTIYFARDKRLSILLLAGLPLAAYAVYTGGDDFGGARFFAPWLPVLVILAFLGASHFGRFSLPNSPSPLITITLLSALLLLTALTAGYRFYQGPSQEAALTEAGLILEEITLPTTTIGVFWAGALPYFGNRTSIDMLGKNDAAIARLPGFAGSFKPGHNKFNYNHSLARLQPDLLISPLSLGLVSDPAAFTDVTEGDNAYAGQLFLDDTFRTNYAPILLYVGTVPIFIHSESIERDRLLALSECQPVTNETLLIHHLETVCWLNGR